MRTTLKIDDDVLRAARALATERERTLGEIVSELARRGLRPAPTRRARRGVPVFDISPGTPPLTPEMVRQAMED